MRTIAVTDRRATPRSPAEGLLVIVRRKGRLARLQGLAVDFNRHGLGLVLDQPLPKDATVFVSLLGAGHRLDNVIGIVHNCSSQKNGYRCGVQFRTGSQLQEDQGQVERVLAELEGRFAGQDLPATG